jgi:cytochrome P450
LSCAGGQDPETGQPLSDQCLVAEFSIAMIAGMDTTTHTLAFFL